MSFWFKFGIAILLIGMGASILYFDDASKNYFEIRH